MDTSRASQNIYKKIQSTAQESYRSPSDQYKMTERAQMYRAASQYTDRDKSTFKDRLLKLDKKETTA